MISERQKACVAILVALLPLGCTEDPLVALDPESAPGASTPTIEVVLDSRDLPLWRDTTYWGFELPNTAPFKQLSDREELRARVLGRFSTIPDSVFVDSARVAIDSFTSVSMQFTIDTARSAVPDDGIEVAVWALSRGFDPAEATWAEARRGEPWSVPGGDLGLPLGADSLRVPTDELTGRPDSVLVALDVDADSLLTAWREAEGEPGFAAVVTGAGADLRVILTALVMEAVPEGIDTVVTIVRAAVPSTFILDPPTPEPTTRLRLGGLPSARVYLDFQLPDSLDFFRLRGAVINKAAIEFVPTAAAAEPFRMSQFLSSQAVRLLADPFQYGEKTPIGVTLGAQVPLEPDSLASGKIARYEITNLLRFWSQSETAVAPPLRVGLAPVPANRELGFWEFFSVEDGAGVRPVVRILYTPNPSFLLP